MSMGSYPEPTGLSYNSLKKKKNEAGTYLPIFYAGQHNSATTRGSERKNNNSLHLNMFAENWF